MIYTLEVFYFLLYRRRLTFYLFLNWFSTRVSRDDQKYLCGRRLYACINTRKFRDLDSIEITSLPDNKKVIYMALHFNHRRKYIACSSQDSFAWSESLQHPTIASLLIKILIFFSTTQYSMLPSTRTLQFNIAITFLC